MTGAENVDLSELFPASEVSVFCLRDQFFLRSTQLNLGWCEAKVSRYPIDLLAPFASGRNTMRNPEG
jgi:hypothetical protein